MRFLESIASLLIVFAIILLAINIVSCGSEKPKQVPLAIPQKPVESGVNLNGKWSSIYEPHGACADVVKENPEKGQGNFVIDNGFITLDFDFLSEEKDRCYSYPSKGVSVLLQMPETIVKKNSIST